MKYKFKYKRKWFWKTHTVSGHRYDDKTGAMELFFDDGSILSIGQWKKCSVRLGKDWVLAVKKEMEKESGQKIELDVNYERKSP